MISLIQGKVVSVGQNKVVLMTRGGVGYTVLVSSRAREKCEAGSEVILETHLVVREDTQELFGFENADEKQLFAHCVGVSGVGPRSALNILALGEVAEISGAIGRGDVEYLTKVSGVGKKTAERIVVELRSKLEEFGAGKQALGAKDGGVLGDVVAGLVALGYSQVQARDAAKKLQTEGKSSEELLREALQQLS